MDTQEGAVSSAQACENAIDAYVDPVIRLVGYASDGTRLAGVSVRPRRKPDQKNQCYAIVAPAGRQITATARTEIEAYLAVRPQLLDLVERDGLRRRNRRVRRREK
jgi:hypothetical protein